jgi:hypothetical protein
MIREASRQAWQYQNNIERRYQEHEAVRDVKQAGDNQECRNKLGLANFSSGNT